ncbi:MAG: hypothetical protein H6Q20_830 [Bacteroidetes bacterium]|nr:hypothetical protein [Bacteroidota bacterium]
MNIYYLEKVYLLIFVINNTEGLVLKLQNGEQYKHFAS